MDPFFQEMLGGVGRLQENVGVTLFLEGSKKTKRKTNEQKYNMNITVPNIQSKKVSCWCVCVFLTGQVSGPGVSPRLIILARGLS